MDWVTGSRTCVPAAGHEEGSNERGWHPRQDRQTSDKRAAVAGGAHAIHGAWHAMTCTRAPEQMRRVRDGTLMVDGTLQRNVALSSVRAAEKQREQGMAGGDRPCAAKPDSWVARRPLRPMPAAALA
jgi:hypothetical protein